MPVDGVRSPAGYPSPMAIATRGIAESCIAAKRAARTLASASTAAKDAALAATARLLDERADAIL